MANLRFALDYSREYQEYTTYLQARSLKSVKRAFAATFSDAKLLRVYYSQGNQLTLVWDHAQDKKVVFQSENSL
jgi:hypothetical protein